MISIVKTHDSKFYFHSLKKVENKYKAPLRQYKECWNRPMSARDISVKVVILHIRSDNSLDLEVFIRPCPQGVKYWSSPTQ